MKRTFKRKSMRKKSTRRNQRKIRGGMNIRKILSVLTVLAGLKTIDAQGRVPTHISVRLKNKNESRTFTAQVGSDGLKMPEGLADDVAPGNTYHPDNRGNVIMKWEDTCHYFDKVTAIDPFGRTQHNMPIPMECKDE